MIDAVCMHHPAGGKPPGESLYQGLPFSEREEEARRAAEYGYFESAVAALQLGLPYRAVQVLGGLPRTPPHVGLLQRASDALHARLGPLYSVVMLTQAALLCGGALAVATRRSRAQLPLLPRRSKAT